MELKRRKRKTTKAYQRKGRVKRKALGFRPNLSKIRTSAKVFVVARSKDQTTREEHRTHRQTDNTYYCIKPILL